MGPSGRLLGKCRGVSSTERDADEKEGEIAEPLSEIAGLLSEMECQIWAGE